MKKRIKEHFGERVVISESPNKECVITLRETASTLLYAFHHQKPTDAEAEKMNIIETAAKFIVSDMRDMDTQQNVYPDTDDIAQAVD